MTSFQTTRRWIFHAALLAFALILPIRAFAQVDTGAISGTVKDSSGGVVAGATITLTNEDNGQQTSIASGAAGEYVFAPIKIGHYSVSVEFAGFRTVQQKNVSVDVQQRVVVDLVLQPGAATETVIVSETPPALQTQDASVGQVIGEQTINALPLNGRNFTFLAQLSAGVTQGQQDTRGLGASGSFSANGLRPAQNNYLLDGIDNNVGLVDFLNGTHFVVLPPVDAIEEFKIQTNSFSAEFGRAAGATLNATIKSGTDSFHGAAWEFFRNDKLDAANFFENANGLKKGKFRQNQFGGAIGGPIRKHRTFFFVDYEGTRTRQAIPYTSTVPTGLERSSGYTNLSELLTQGGTQTDALGRTTPLGQVFDPATTRAVFCGVPDSVSGITAPCPSGTATGSQIGFAREPFAGNIIPADRLDPNAIALLNLFPTPTNSGLFNNFGSNPALQINANQFDVRVDHKFSDKDQAFGRVSYSDTPELIPGPFTGVADGGSFSAGEQTAKSINVALSETHSFSPTLVNEARIGVNRIASNRVQPFSNDLSDIPGRFGIQGVPQVSGNGGLGSIFITGLNTLGSNQFLPSIETSLTSQYMDNVTKVWGKHETKFGFEHQHLRFTILQPPSGRGAWSFSGVYTEVPSSGGGNTGLAQMLLIPIKSTVAGGFDFVGGADEVQASNYANTDMGRNYNAAYVQDDWKVTPKLTVNLGVRWEYFGQIIERYGASTNFQPATATTGPRFLLTKRRCGVPFSADLLAAAAADNISIQCIDNPGLGESQKTNFGPRLGLAYRVTPQLVVRAGSGLFFGGFENSTIGTYFDFPFQFNLVYPSLGPSVPITFANGSLGTLETGLSALVPITSGSAEPAGAGLIGQDFHLKTPYTLSYNLTVQYQLSQSQTIQAAYVGNGVRHLGVYINPNSPNQILPPGLNPFDFSPYPDFPTGFIYTSFAGNSNYHSLQLNYERQFSQGLQALANFTWSKCRTDATDVLNETALAYRAPLLPGFGIQGDYGLCDFDINKVFHFSGTYELPFGAKKRFLSNMGKIADVFLGGWKTNWILTLQDGQPFTVHCVNTTTSGFGCNALLVPGQNVYAGPHNVDQWLNPNAFADPPAATTVGQADRTPLGGAATQFVGPGFHRLDFSLFKTFRTSETTSIEFRSEFFNLTNHPNFSAPGFSGNGVVAAPGSLDYTNPSTFGKIASTRDGQNDQREIQFALKFYF
jgi:Carboxypeptidase regulatory-like domain/TonB-dependent Receptor Plug Domain/TonB dependent receptor